MPLQLASRCLSCVLLMCNDLRLCVCIACLRRSMNVRLLLLLNFFLITNVYQDLVAAEQEKFSSLLRCYLDATYPPGAARSVFPRLLMKLTDIRNLNEEHSQVLLKVNPEGIQPLMKEVLDLSC